MRFWNRVSGTGFRVSFFLFRRPSLQAQAPAMTSVPAPLQNLGFGIREPGFENGISGFVFFCSSLQSRSPAVTTVPAPLQNPGFGIRDPGFGNGVSSFVLFVPPSVAPTAGASDDAGTRPPAKSRFRSSGTSFRVRDLGFRFFCSAVRRFNRGRQQ